MRALIVEDENGIRESIKLGLESNKYVVDTAGDGIEGCRLAKTVDYDLIVLDNNLPLKSGEEICKEIRSMGKMSYIVMISGATGAPIKIESLKNGVDEYISKPFFFAEFYAMVCALMRRPYKIEMDVLEFGDIKMDISKHLTYCNDQALYLTKKEFELLEYMLRNPGVALTRDRILSQVWQNYNSTFSNTLDMHIRNLRKKIETLSTKKIIYTIPSVGYKIDYNG